MSDGVTTLEREQPDSFDPEAEVCEIAGILNVKLVNFCEKAVSLKPLSAVCQM